MAHIPDFLRYGLDNEPTAEPAFRTLLYLDASLSDSSIHAGLAALFDIFVETYRNYLWGLVVRDVGIKRTRRSINAASLSLAHSWLARTSKVAGSSLRLNAAPNETFDAPRIPHLRFEEDQGRAIIELAGPPEIENACSFAEAITPVVAAFPLLCGVMGFGFHMPASLDSRGFILPARTNRYRCAVEILVRDPPTGLTRERSAFRFDRYPEVQPGIADIGWRTFLGRTFLDALPNLHNVTTEPGVVLDHQANIAIVTAGPYPIWGDMQANEDISCYRAIAKALAPVCMSREVMLKSYFNGPEGNPEAEQRLDAYRARFD